MTFTSGATSFTRLLGPATQRIPATNLFFTGCLGASSKAGGYSWFSLTLYNVKSIILQMQIQSRKDLRTWAGWALDPVVLEVVLGFVGMIIGLF